MENGKPNTNATTMIIEITSPNTFGEYLKRNQLIFIDFYAPWCFPCVLISPTIQELARKYPHILFLRVNVDEMQSIAAKFRIASMPSFLFLLNQTVLATIIGAESRKIKSKMTKLAKTAPIPMIIPPLRKSSYPLLSSPTSHRISDSDEQPSKTIDSGPPVLPPLLLGEDAGHFGRFLFETQWSFLE
jgi:thioredoxin 1